jgi:hypothetical protein
MENRGIHDPVDLAIRERIKDGYFVCVLDGEVLIFKTANSGIRTTWRLGVVTKLATIAKKFYAHCFDPGHYPEPVTPAHFTLDFPQYVLKSA